MEPQYAQTAWWAHSHPQVLKRFASNVVLEPLQQHPETVCVLHVSKHSIVQGLVTLYVPPVLLVSTLSALDSRHVPYARQEHTALRKPTAM